jgi:hypothetical protein
VAAREGVAPAQVPADLVTDFEECG